ncbi:MAG: ABC transporter ATP-binding protein [Desulfobacterales bacterium]|jgi:branched-chain amino acid transport system ATP-binding protein|nr:ABC transporter ATP-binding protein [Desulfobacteraceae bacterium]MBT4363045.1 ABC transporter ATP-binding protein [Desulfobacteraceae bacterium]MBT7085825.1 ABC transporter ATP-binding protein [Desulfobacterales bacterium]MBT7698518.1 ABC transporter ATP-binding protein [Desulfobacterales bacterium]
MNKVLEVKNLRMNFGGLSAIDTFNLDVSDGEIVAVIGPNGAGKTTLFNCITGLYTASSGDILISPPDKKTKSIIGFKPNIITESGLARTFQNIRLFSNMTVLENVMIGRHCRLNSGIIGAIFRPKTTVNEEEQVVQDSYDILEKIGLEKYVNEFAKNLPYGAQRRLEIARALATDPFLLLLDEPAAGMNMQETKELDDLILKIRDEEKISILLIEHDMSLVMSLSDRIIVMDYGKNIAQGNPAEIKRNTDVIKAYLGETFA